MACAPRHGAASVGVVVTDPSRVHTLTEVFVRGVVVRSVVVRGAVVSLAAGGVTVSDFIVRVGLVVVRRQGLRRRFVWGFRLGSIGLVAFGIRPRLRGRAAGTRRRQRRERGPVQTVLARTTTHGIQRTTRVDTTVRLAKTPLVEGVA